ncbi:MAG: hypothetical protein HY908_29450 [Myxococcales bacterium]|nr:hypothetical protein [Myxococcales bacterium]
MRAPRLALAALVACGCTPAVTSGPGPDTPPLPHTAAPSAAPVGSHATPPPPSTAATVATEAPPASCEAVFATLRCLEAEAPERAAQAGAQARALGEALVGVPPSTARQLCERAAEELAAAGPPVAGCGAGAPVASAGPVPTAVAVPEAGVPGTGKGFASSTELVRAAVHAVDAHDPALVRALFPSDAVLDGLARCTDPAGRTPKDDVHREVGRMLGRLQDSVRVAHAGFEEKPQKTLRKGTDQKGCRLLADVQVVELAVRLRITDTRSGQISSDTEHGAAIVVGGRWYLVDN